MHSTKQPPIRRPSLDVPVILTWADDHFNHVGKYPATSAGSVLSIDAPLGMNWRKIDNALRYGAWGLEGGTSLAAILEKHRGVRNRANLPKLTDDIILGWIDAHRKRTGEWPNASSGPISDASGETWHNVDAALRQGIRGLRGGRSLARLIAGKRGVRNRATVPQLTVVKILRMADAYKRAKKQWPTRNSGQVPGFPGETWLAVRYRPVSRGERFARRQFACRTVAYSPRPAKQEQATALNRGGYIAMGSRSSCPNRSLASHDLRTGIRLSG